MSKFITVFALLLLLSVFFGGLLFLQKTEAATITWDGGGGDNDWSTAANWSTDTVPGSGDYVVFDGTSAKDAIIDAGFAGWVYGISITADYAGTITAARSLSTLGGGVTVAGGTFDLDGNNLDINNWGASLTISGGTFELNGDGVDSAGTVYVDNNFTVNGGTVDFDAGTLEFTGSDYNNAYSKLTCGSSTDIDDAYNIGAVHLAKSTYGRLEVGANCILDATSTVAGGVIIVSSGGELNITGNFSAWAFVNAGTFSMTGTTLSTVNDNMVLQTGASTSLPNVTTIDINTGNLTVGSGVTFEPPALTSISIEKNIDVDASATVDLNGATLVFDGSSYHYDHTDLSCGTVIDFDDEYNAGAIQIAKTSDGRFTVGANCVIDATKTTTQGYVAVSSGGELNITGDMTAWGFTNAGTFTMTGTTWSSVNGGMVMYEGANTSAPNLTTVNVDAGVFVIETNVTFEPPALANMTIERDFTVASGATVDWNDALITFDGNGSGDNTIVTSAIDLPNVKVNKNSGYTTLFSDGTTVAGDLTFTSGIVSNPASASSIHVEGDVACTSSQSTGGANLEIIMDGSGDQELSSSCTSFNSPVVISKTTGNIEMDGDLTTASTCTIYDVVEFRTNGYDVDCAGDFVLNDAGATLALNGDELLNGLSNTAIGAIKYVGDGDAASDDFTIADIFTTYPDLIIDADDGLDNFILGSAIDVNGDIVLDGGTLDASSNNYAINLAGDWTDGSGGFSPQSGTVTLDGADQTIYGDTTFYRLSKTAEDCGGTDQDICETLTFEANKTTTIQNQMTLQGTDEDNLLALRSTVEDTSTNLNPPSAITIAYLDVQDNTNTDAPGTLLNCDTGCVDSGNNNGWEFVNPGVGISPTSITVTEAGSTDTFDVVLQSEPTDTVTIPVSSSDTGEVLVDKASLIFTTGNWDTPQTVTATGVDDNVVDGDQTVSIVLGVITSNDVDYSGLNPGDVTVTVEDDDVATVTTSSISGNTTEDGGTATFTVVLDAQPNSNVTIPISSSDTGEGTVSPSSLVFTTSTWDEEQTVTVTGVNDNYDDGDAAYAIVLGAITSGDGAFDGVNPDDVSATNEDNDVASLTLNATTATTTEAGGTAGIRIYSSVIPNGDIVISFSSSDTGEVATPSDVTIDSSNWNSGALLTLTGVDDGDLDGDQVVTISDTSITANDDNAFTPLDLDDITVTNTDDEVGYTVSSISGNTAEDGTTATFTIELATEPTDDVTFSVASSDTSEGTVSPAFLTFTALNWDTPQTVTVTGVDDDIEDGNVAYNITFGSATSDDSRFSGTSPNNVSVTNEDDGDTAGVTVSSISGDISEDGTTATFTVVLTSEPVGTATISVSSSDTGEGTVSPSSLSFTGANWDIPQTVTVTGVDDAVVDGDIDFTVIIGAVSGGGSAYSGIDPDDISVTNIDNNNPGVDIVNGGLSVSETGTTDSFTIALGGSPVDTVVINIASSDTGEVTVSPSSVTFDSDNWDTPQTITVTGVDDELVDGTQSPSITLIIDQDASDSGYDNLSIPSQAVSVSDDDAVGITLAESSGSTAVSESGSSDSFSVALNAAPTGDVTFTISSGDTGEVTVSSADSRWSSGEITFDGTNWDSPAVITVTGVDDIDIDGDEVVYITFGTFSSSDLAFNGYTPGDTVEVTNADDDTYGVTVTALNGAVTESGATATFTIVLQSEPSDDVVFTVTLDDDSEATATPSTLTFTNANWDEPQTVVLSAVDDLLDDGNSDNGVSLTIASDDTDYDGYTRDSFTFDFTVVDNETAQVIISESNGNTSAVEGSSDSYTIQLSTEPTDDVVITVSESSDDISVSPTSVTFTDSNWNTPQTITVTALNDTERESEETVIITHSVTSDTDNNYDGISANNVIVTVVNRSSGGNREPDALVTPSIQIISPEEGVSIEASRVIRFSWEYVSLREYPVRVRIIDLQSRAVIGEDVLSSGTESYLVDTSDYDGRPFIFEVALTDTMSIIASDNLAVNVSGSDNAESTSGKDDLNLPDGLEAGDLIKRADLPDVYIIAEDGTRRPFFNEHVFFAYNLNFADIRNISEKDMASIKLGRPVPLPSTKLLHFMGGSKVYEVISTNSPTLPSTQKTQIRHLESEEAAIREFGNNWKEMIISLPIGLFASYEVIE